MEILELKNTITKLNNSIESFKRNWPCKKEKKEITHLKGKTLKITSQRRKKKKRMKKSEESLHKL